MATGPSTTTSPYLLPYEPNVRFTSILAVGDSVNLKPDGITPYRMVGIPDGLGAFDNGNGTFTLLMNHEVGPTAGVPRAHGTAGSFVSQWIINKADLGVVSGSDLIQSQRIWDTATSSYVTAVNPIGRLCSGDLGEVSAFWNAATGRGTQDRIFLSGEETGAEGRLFGHVVTGSEAGVSYQLAALGRTSYENAVANAQTGDKTVLLTTDDSTPGQVYFYIGDKQDSGSVVERAGLTNGQLYGIVAEGIGFNATSENNLASAPLSGNFSLAALPDQKNQTGAQLEANSDAAQVSEFWRPEDIAWDPTNANVAYFVTTANFSGPSKLYRLTFTDVTDPSKGGTFEALLDGTEGQRMMDNLSVNADGTLTIVEDVGNNARLGHVWHYDPATDTLSQIAEHDPARFLSGAPGFLTQDEEASGVIDVTSILGDSDTQAFLLDVQAHYPLAGELVEGGQLLAMFIDEVKDGGAGNDRVAGDGGDNKLNGNAGDDSVLGGSGNDILLGARGNDLLDGGRGNDVLQGGLDNDIFVISVTNGDVDYITDFKVGQDTLDFADGVSVLSASIQRVAATEANGFSLGNSDRAFDLTLTLSNGSETQTLHVLDAYAFATNSYWETTLGLDLTYPQPLPVANDIQLISSLPIA